MKGQDLIAVLEYGMNFGNKAKKPRRRKPKEAIMNLDDLPADVLINKLENYERKAKIIKDWIKDKEKVNKEDKKEEKKGWEKYSFIQKFTILTATVPLVMMGYSLFIILFIKAAARAMGM